MNAGDLHRHHLAHDPKGTGWRVDLGHAASIRIEAQAGALDRATKKALAYRIAVCWNVLEGIPTDDLMGGAVRNAFEAARSMCDALEKGAPDKALEALRAFRAADKALAAVETDVDCDCAEHAPAEDVAGDDELRERLREEGPSSGWSDEQTNTEAPR